ncbi:IS630 family transposase [Candidatus Tisiphia endosymbiont of Dioctria rufipes]|uniref:IS630 family transposase n=1 Tax=Candidatus Tisiphia endosymbiont of Dioctria rufipes TaxID=3066255 RepID=UPI00312C725D
MIMGNILTSEQRTVLKSRHGNERDRRVCDRIKAVLLYDKGWSYGEIAEALLLSEEAIRKHVRDYQKFNKLETANGGSASKLSELEEKELIEHLEVCNYVYAKDISNYIEKKYGVAYTIAGVIKLLRRLGFVYKKPKIVPGKLDIDKQELFKLEYSLLKGNLKAKEAIYFMDSVHPQYQTKARYGWIRKNQNKTLPTFSGWKRKHLIGAINLSDLQLVSTDNPKVNGDYIINFLQKLEAENPNKEKIYLICDNAGYHKSKKVKEYLVNSKIELVFLPPYSPNLNPIERLWKLMHRIVTNNKFYHNFAQFSEAIDRFFANINKYKGNLLTLITDQFQTIIFNHFANSSG